MSHAAMYTACVLNPRDAKGEKENNFHMTNEFAKLCFFFFQLQYNSTETTS